MPYSERLIRKRSLSRNKVTSIRLCTGPGSSFDNQSENQREENRNQRKQERQDRKRSISAADQGEERIEKSVVVIHIFEVSWIEDGTEPCDKNNKETIKTAQLDGNSLFSRKPNKDPVRIVGTTSNRLELRS